MTKKKVRRAEVKAEEAPVEVKAEEAPGAEGQAADAEADAEAEADAGVEGPREDPAVFLGLKRRMLWGLGVLAALAALVYLASLVRSVAVPLLVAFIIAYLLDPVVDRFEARKVPRTSAIVILLASFLTVLALLTLLIIPQVVAEFGQVPGKVSLLLTRADPYLQEQLGLELPASLRELVTNTVGQLQSTELKGLAAPVGRVLQGLFGGTVSLLASLAGLLMIPVFAFYLLRDFDLIVARIRELLPAAYREPVSARFRDIDGAMSAFVRGQLTVSSILALLYTVGFWAVGLPLATLVGISAGLGNIVPYLGTAVGLILATSLAILDWHGWGPFLAVYAVFGVVQFLEGWVITPKIVGDSVGLSPFVIIVAVLVFGELFGFFGVLVAVPLAAILKILLKVVLDFYRESEFYREA
ncbi:MAG: AI-2E family transporter [Deltaproteobacteria bacterium]|nr:AI-2E family transporter [Deltaproteobacteria bacterium]